MTTVAMVTRDPGRLEALCHLWQSTDREVWIRLQGVSMCPTILPGTRVRLRCHRREIPDGAIIAYRLHSFLIVHRLEKIVEGPEGGHRMAHCRGDHVGKLDPPIPVDAIVGEVIQIGRPPVSTWLKWKVHELRRLRVSAMLALRRYTRRP